MPDTINVDNGLCSSKTQCISWTGRISV